MSDANPNRIRGAHAFRLIYFWDDSPEAQEAITDGTSPYVLNGAWGGAFTFTGTDINLDPTGTFDLDMDNGQAFSIDIDGAASNISLATDGAAQDLTVAVTGATDSSLVLSSAGTGADALQITASAGGIDISSAAQLDLVSAAEACGWTHTADGAGDDLTIAVAGATDSSLILSSTGTGADALQITASAGGIDITSAAQLDLVSANEACGWTHTADGAADDLTIQVAGAFDASLVLASAGTGSDALQLTASAGGIDITAATDVALGSRTTTTDGVADGTARVIGGRAYSSVADSTTVTNIAVPTLADTTYTIPADTLKSGSVLEIFAVCRTIAVNGADTIQYTLQITDSGGANVLVASTAINVGANNRVLLHGKMTFREAPDAAVGGSGYFVSEDLSGGAPTAGPAAGAVVTYDTANAAGLIAQVLVTHSAQNAGNQSVVESMYVDII